MLNRTFTVATAVASALSIAIAVLSSLSPAFQARAGIAMSVVALLCAILPGRAAAGAGSALASGLVLGGVSTVVGVLLFGVVLGSYTAGVIAGATLIGAVAGALGGLAGRALVRGRSAAMAR